MQMEAEEVGMFEGLPPQLIIDELRKLTAEEVIGGKTFWKTYEKWDKLSSARKTNTVVFMEKNLTDEVRSKVFDAVREALKKEAQEDKQRQAHTNKHDKCRLLHLRKDPRAASVWARAIGDKTRVELDADHHQESASSWTELANMFNDYATYVYENACVYTNRSSPSSAKIAVAGMEKIFQDCHDMNPTSPNRPIRDAKWVRQTYRDLKSQITLTFENYHRSGQQANEHPYDEWTKFSKRTGQDVVTYSRALFNSDELQAIGRTIRKDVARDTGILKEASAVELQAQAEEWKAGLTGRKRKRPTDGEQKQSTKTVATVLEHCLVTQMLLQYAEPEIRSGIVADMLKKYKTGSESTTSSHASSRPSAATPRVRPLLTPIASPDDGNGVDASSNEGSSDEEGDEDEEE